MTKRFLKQLSLVSLLLHVAAVCASAETSPPSRFSLISPPPARPVSAGLAAPVLVPAGILTTSALPETALSETPEKEWQPPVLFAEKEDRLSAAQPAATSTSEWRWRRAVPADYAAIAVAGIGTLYIENQHGDPSARWTARNDFDEGIRDALRLESRSARDAANDAGTALMGLMLAAPIIDSFATLGLRDSHWDALWQTEVINAEALTFAGTVSSLLQNLIIPRERPFVRNCQNGQCEDSPLNRSMPSGHAAFAFTGAGLICTNHHYQSLYNDPGADRAACVAGIGVATVDGILRIVADRHYATDVIAGAAIGLFSGFLLPRWLYYYRPQQTAGEDEPAGKSMVGQMTVTPLIYSDGAGLNYSLTF